MRSEPVHAARAGVLPRGGMLGDRRVRLSGRCHSRPPGALFLRGLLRGLGAELPPAGRLGRRAAAMAHARPRGTGAGLRPGRGRRALRAERGGAGIQDRVQIGEDFGALAARLPAGIRFGTSSWNYPGWGGLVYHREYEGRGASAKMLREYAEFPLFRTVGIDSSFY